MRTFLVPYRQLIDGNEFHPIEALFIVIWLLLKHFLGGRAMDPVTIMATISAGLALIDKFYDLATKVKGEEPGPHSFELEVNKEQKKLTVKEHGHVTHEMEEKDLRLGEFDQVRHDTLKRKIERNWKKYNALDEEKDMAAVEERIRLEQHMDKIKTTLCSDFRELIQIYEDVLGMVLPDHYTLYQVCD